MKKFLVKTALVAAAGYALAANYHDIKRYLKIRSM
jgi:hypothetical protein